MSTTHRAVLGRGGRRTVTLLFALMLALLLGGAMSSSADAAGAPPAKECADLIDNDGDGKIDHPDDPGCGSTSDNSEQDDPPQCSDDLDNDGDLAIDYPADPGCAGPTDDIELDGAISPQCSDGVDNDGDGKIDYVADPGCTGPADDDETDPPPPPPPPAQCADGVDNDGDGKIDHPADPGCTGPADDDEADPLAPPPPPPPPPPPAPPAPPPPAPAVVLPACADGRDNDGDGRVDSLDPGCTNASDNDETDPQVRLAGSSANAAARLLSPFPVVRLRGRIYRTLVVVNLLSVTAPRGSKVTIRCRGPRRSCPRAKTVTTLRRSGATRLRRFQRRLRAGTVLRIYVTRSGFVGKYTRFTIRRGRAPLRSDGCSRSNATWRRCP